MRMHVLSSVFSGIRVYIYTLYAGTTGMLLQKKMESSQ